MHLLGLWIPEEPAILGPTLTRLVELRTNRNKTIIANLNRHGVDLSYAEVEHIADGGSVGRPHIARALVRKKVTRDMEEAFQNWLRPGTKAYVPKEKITPAQALDIFRAEQATVILAHPCTLRLDADDLERLLRELKEMGLDGVEVFYPMHSQAQTNEYAHLCRKLDLLPSAGSDFHGSYKPDIALGRGKGGLYASYDLVRRMKEHRAKLGQPVPGC
jgi:predicted metal-dependent phosphoesterase TrpH